MLFHDWIPPPIMITKEKLNTYPPLFNERPVTMAWQVFHFLWKSLFSTLSEIFYFLTFFIFYPKTSLYANYTQLITLIIMKMINEKIH